MADISSIAEKLKAARIAKGLSQTALAGRAGVPQSHISRIESGAVDLQTSSLIQLARALDLELMLLPRELSPAVQSLQRDRLPAPDVLETARYIHGMLARVTRMKKRFGEEKGLQALEQSISHVGRLPYRSGTAARDVALYGKTERLLDDIEKRSIRANRISKEDRTQLSAAANELHDLDRGTIFAATPRPAYTLDDEDDDV